jgi:hypothetical protein
MAPKTVRLICPPLIMAKLSDELNKADPSNVVIVSFPALIRSGSILSLLGKGPMPSRPFSDCNTTEISLGI